MPMERLKFGQTLGSIKRVGKIIQGSNPAVQYDV